jgi:hypothetical protein
MTTAIPPLSLLLENLGSMTIGTPHGDPTPMDARVLEMINKNTVRLSVLGVSIDADTLKPLMPGTSIKVRLEQADGKIRLVLQAEPGGETATRSTPAQSPLKQTELTPPVMTGARVAIDRIMTDAQIDGRSRPHVAPDYVLALLDEAAEAMEGSGTGAASTTRSPKQDISQQVLDTHANNSQLTGATSSLRDRSTPALNDPAQFTFLPHGTSQPLHLHVVREDQQQSASGPKEFASPVWSVRFSFSTPDLGDVHTVIRQGPAGIGVDFYPAMREAAEALKPELGELREMLTASALDIDEITVSMNPQSGAYTLAAGHPA